MERTSASAKERIDALDTECYAIADELSRATMLLRDEGLPIEKVLVNRIASLDKDIRDACEELRAWATELGVADLPDPFTTSVRCARQMLQQIAITEVDVKRERDAALAILEQVLAIRTIDQTAFAPLETCQDAARQLRADILDVQPPALHLDAAALVAGTHPFAALLALFDPHALDNTAYDRYLEQVETSFERSLRGALFRNQLTLHAATTAPDSYASVQREEPGNGDTTPAGSSADTPLAGAAADIPEITPQAELLLEEAAEPGATPPIIDSATSETLVVQATPQPLDTLSAAPEPEPGKYENGRWLAAETTFIPNLVLSDIPETAFDIKLSQARQLAKELIAIAPEERAASLADLIFLLLAEQRSAEAYQISRVCEQVYAEQNTALPEWFVRALALGVHLQGSYTAIANTLQDDMVTFNTDLFQQGDEQMQRALTLLGVGALLPIAMLAPETGAAELLLYLPARNLPKAINRVRQAIGEFFKTHSAIDANTMRFLRDNSVWEQEWQDILTDTQDYWDDAENKRLVYAPASEVWWNWTRPGGFVYQMIQPILDDEPNNLEKALEAMKQLGTPQNIKREIHHTDRQVIGREVGDDISDKAFQKIGQLAQNAVKLTRRWASVCETRPEPEMKERLDRIAELRHTVLDSLEDAYAELNALEQSDTPTMGLRCGVYWCRQALRRAATILETEPETQVLDLAFRYALNGPLLRSVDLQIDSQWEPARITPQFGDALLDIIINDDGTWQSILDAYHAADDHQTTAWIIEYLEAQEGNSARVIALRRRRETQLKWLRANLYTTLALVRLETNKAIAHGLIWEEGVLENEAVLHSLKNAIDTQLQFKAIRAALQQLSDDIKDKTAAGLARVKQKLEQSQLPQTNPAWLRIQQALKDQDPLTANEYLTLALEGQELPTTSGANGIFEQFFLKDFRALTEYLSTNGEFLALVKSLREGRDQKTPHQLGPITIWPGVQAFDAARLIEAWLVARRIFTRTTPSGGWKISAIEPAVRDVFNNLGFTTKSVALLDRPSQRLWLTVKTEIVQNKDLCPVRTYGSSAQGQYRLLIIADRATEEDIIADISDPVRALAPIIIFYFGRMSENNRRALASLCREKHRTCILIDDTLMLFLSEQRPPRLKRLFECTLPFTYLEPYVTTASVVPYEVFYGRQREVDEILDPMGSCFLYGGRQLGKTALLRHVEEVAHDPAKGRIVRWIDLKAESIGLKVDLDSIWEVIARELKPFDVFPSNVRANTAGETYLRHIDTWLKADPDRRIILLLDEADHFLDSDAKDKERNQKNGFPRVDRIKGLMDQTKRRFKVVFAGLHNLQRTTRQENNPLAHYGQPLRIGPLLDNNGWREARNLLEQPLGSLGYRFESAELVTRILSQTNYYPSLLQLYGAEMIRYLTKPYNALFPLDSSPPYTITAQHLEAIYRNPDLHEGIRHRFRLTLQLDPRYEVITYVVAYNALDDEQELLLNGMSVSEIRGQSLHWWSQGFANDSSEELFLALLEELVGLGIFRRVNGNRFTLRNANMLLLVGTKEKVLAELEVERELPSGYDAATFRSTVAAEPGDRSAVARRSPITANQESELRKSGHGVTIVFGTEAAGLPGLGAYLRQTLGQGFIIDLKEGVNEEDFSQALQNLTQRERNGTTLLFVPPETGWTIGWAEQTNNRLSRLTSRTDFARVVFVADSAHTWKLLTQEGPALEKALADFARPMNLVPWQDAALRQWIIDCGISPGDKAGRHAVANATGNWPYLLLRYFQRVRDVPSGWKNVLEDMEKELGSEKQLQALCKVFGLTIDQPVNVLSTMADLDPGQPINTADLIYFLADVDPIVIQQSLRWADLLSLIKPTGPNQWLMQELVAKVLTMKKASE